MTAVSITDDLTPAARPNQLKQTLDPGEMLLGDGNLETAILRMVKDDPFATVGEMSRELRAMGRFGHVGWWDTFGILRQRGLLRRRSRFQFARGRL